jgi:hypothetical protein
MTIGMTGLEQYSLERAGYFIRRTAIDPDASRPLSDHPLISALGCDLFQKPRVVSRAPEPPSHDWRRAAAVDQSLPPAAQLAGVRSQPALYIARLALSQDLSLRVVPGSHEDPVLPPTGGDDAADGAVLLRLEAGDMLVYSSHLLYRQDPSCSPAIAYREVVIEPAL